MAKKELVSIIIPYWNQKEFISYCFEGLFKNTLYPHYEVIVVDADSDDGGEETLRKFEKMGKIKYIRNENRTVFAKTCNKGAEVANGEYLVFLNIDTYPLPKWLTEMVKVLQKSPEIAVVAGKWIYPKTNRVQHAGVVFFNQGGRILPYHLYRFLPSNLYCVDKEREFQAVSCAATIVETEVFFEAGRFDENLCNGLEDIDLWLRVKELGYKIYYTPHSNIIHHESVVCAGSYQNEELFIKKWEKKIEDNHDKYYEEDGFNPEAIRVLSKEFGDYLFMGVDSLEDLEIFKTGFKNPQMLDVYEKKVAKNLLSISMNLFKIKPTTPLFRIRSISGIVRAYIWQQDFVQTEKYFKLLSSIDGEKSVKIQKCLSYYNIASFLEKKNLLREAEGKFKKIIELLMLFNLREEKGLIGGAYFHLGCIRQRMGETEKARDYFKECLKLIPDHNKARENLETLKGK